MVQIAIGNVGIMNINAFFIFVLTITRQRHLSLDGLDSNVNNGAALITRLREKR